MDLYEMIHVERWPRLRLLRQPDSLPPVEDIQEHIYWQIAALPGVDAGMRVALAVGSRGINQLGDVLAGAIGALRTRGARPYIVPAMGSHGGASARGQADVLSALSVSEKTLGVPVAQGVETVISARLASGTPLYTLKNALAADGIILINKIKSHTSFRGRYESGLLKMAVVGLGCHQGAMQFHALGFSEMADNLVEMGTLALEALPILGGIGLVENASGGLGAAQVIPKKQILEREPQLLRLAKASAPRIPFEALDVLVLGQIGKEISGDGMDPNVTGRYTPAEMAPDYAAIPRIRKIVVCDLSPHAGGSGIGIGNTDATTQKAFEKIDLEKTYLNALSATVTNTCMLPMILPNERHAIEAVLMACRGVTAETLRMCLIQDTKHLQKMYVSQALVGSELKSCQVTYGSTEHPMEFDVFGNLLLPEPW